MATVEHDAIVVMLVERDENFAHRDADAAVEGDGQLAGEDDFQAELLLELLDVLGGDNLLVSVVGSFDQFLDEGFEFLHVLLLGLAGLPVLVESHLASVVQGITCCRAPHEPHGRCHHERYELFH